MQKMIKGYIFAVLSAIIYGCMPLMAKYIYADGVTPATLVFLRNLLALPSLAILALAKNKTLKVPVKSLFSISVISFFGCCVTPILLFSSYNYIASGTATVFHFVYPAIVVLAGIFFLKKKAHIGTLVSVAVCFVGICLFYDPNVTFNIKGSALSLLSGITFAVYVVLLSNFKYGEVSGFLFSFYVAAVSSIMTFIICLATHSLSFPSSLSGWGLCVLFAVAVTTVAVVLFQQSTFLIGGEKTSILSVLEPITSIVVGIILFDEPIVLRILIGSALVIAAAVSIAVSDLKFKAKSSKTAR